MLPTLLIGLAALAIVLPLFLSHRATRKRQRTLERYLHRVRLVQQLGLITSEAQESALPEQMEPLLVPESGEMQAIDLVEDELILALPVVPINPDSELPSQEWHEEPEEEKQNPFGVLSQLKDNKQ